MKAAGNSLAEARQELRVREEIVGEALDVRPVFDLDRDAALELRRSRGIAREHDDARIRA